MRAIVVGCGKAKRSEPCEARDMYTSTYFGKKYDAAEAMDGDVYILSAEYGLIPPDQSIDPYDTVIDDLGDAERHRLSEETSDMLSDYDEVVILAGVSYREVVDHDNTSSPFVDTSGIGEQMAVLSEIANE